MEYQEVYEIVKDILPNVQKIITEADFNKMVGKANAWYDNPRKVFPACRGNKWGMKTIELASYYRRGHHNSEYKKGAYGGEPMDTGWTKSPVEVDHTVYALVVIVLDEGGDSSANMAESWQQYGAWYAYALTRGQIAEMFSDLKPGDHDWDDCYFCRVACQNRLPEHSVRPIRKGFRRFLDEIDIDTSQLWLPKSSR